MPREIPNYPVPSVRLILTDAGGRVLLLQRAAGGSGGGAWCLPGGKVEYGETVEEAVRTELAEETSLTCTSSRFLFYQDSPPMEPGGMHCLNLYFECAWAGEVRLNHESDGYAWVAPADLDRYPIVFRNREALLLYWSPAAPAP
jgi:8-oxo-dGTP diphosphatase